MSESDAVIDALRLDHLLTNASLSCPNVISFYFVYI